MRYLAFHLVVFLNALWACVKMHAAPVYEVAGSFAIGPRNPGRAALLLHTDGNFYGTTPSGGAAGSGTIYRVTPSGTVSLVASFGSTGPGYPTGKLIADEAGNLWGTSGGGGENGFGTIFRYHLETGMLQTVFEFTEETGGEPQAGLVPDGQGWFWGTVPYGGASGSGSVFKVNAVTGAFQIVVDFTGAGAVPGGYPWSDLLNDGEGNLWGTTRFGGTEGTGSVFRINIATGAFTSVYQFPSFSNPSQGANPYAELTDDGAGFIWGTTSRDHSASQGAVIFKINRSTGAATTVRVLNPTEGQGVQAGLCKDEAGFMWGSATGGGANGRGTIFKVHIASGVLTVVYHFPSDTSPEFGFPTATFVRDGAGLLWAPVPGGSGNMGGILRVNSATGNATAVANFSANAGLPKGEQPNSGLVGDGAGYLWGTTTLGGDFGYGTVYKMHERSGVVTTIAQFRDEKAGPQGSYPYAGLVADGAGYFWGSTSAGGTAQRGTIFKVHIGTGVLTTVVNFTGNGALAKGSAPIAAMVRDPAGMLWGSTRDGGTSGMGTIFRLNPTTNSLTTIVNFDGGTHGRGPIAALVRDSAGFFWGSTRGATSGPTSQLGTIFKVNAATGAITTVVRFTGLNGSARGNTPFGALVSDGAGSFLGTTSSEITGQVNYLGTIFRVNASSGVLTTLAYFTGSSEPTRGRNPWAGLLDDGRGMFWGTTHDTFDSNIYKISASGAFSNVVSFTGDDGAAPGRSPGYGTLLKHTDGNFYGTTSESGPLGGGTIYRLRFGPTPVTRPASDVRARIVRLHGTVNPNGAATNAVFEWGLSPEVLDRVSATFALPEATSPVAFDAEIPDLTPGNTYYFRVRAENPDQFAPQIGEVLSFTTNVLPAGGSVSIVPAIVEPASSAMATAVGWSDSDGPLKYQFFIDEAPLDPPAAAAGIPFVAPATVGEHQARVRVFDSRGDFTDASVSFTVNHAPVVRSVTLDARSGAAASLHVAKLLARVYDPDGDAITLSSVALVSTHAGTISLSGGIVIYDAAAGFLGDDAFTFTVRDARGSLVNGTVRVHVEPPDVTPLNVVSIAETADGFLVKFAGVPSASYSIEFRETLNGPWGTLNPAGVLSAGQNGLFEFEDKPNPRPPMRFYRAVAVP